MHLGCHLSVHCTTMVSNTKNAFLLGGCLGSLSIHSPVLAKLPSIKLVTNLPSKKVKKKRKEEETILP